MRVGGVFLKGEEGITQVLLDQGVDVVLREAQEPLDGEPIICGRKGRGGGDAEAFAWRGRGFLARGPLGLALKGGHLGGQLSASYGASQDDRQCACPYMSRHISRDRVVVGRRSCGGRMVELESGLEHQ